MSNPSRKTDKARGSTAIALQTPAFKEKALGDLDLVKIAIDPLWSSIAGDKHPDKIRIVQHTQALCRGLAAVHKICNCPKELRLFLLKGVCRYLSQATSESEWVAGAKYLLTFPIARYLGNPEPSSPFQRHFLTHRRYHRWLSARFNQFSEKNTFFFSSWLQAKRGCDPLSEGVILESFLKHRRGMETEDCGTADLVKEIFKEGSNFCKLMKLVKNKLHKVIRERRACSPSPNASILSCRSAGGQRSSLIAYAMGVLERKTDHGCDFIRDFGYLIDKATGDYSDLFQVYEAAQDESLLWEMHYVPCAVIAGGPRSNVIIETRTTRWFPELEQTLKNRDITSDPDFLVDRFWGDDGPYTRTVPIARVAPVLEPLKVRLVSAGPSMGYACLKTYQQDIHSVLKSIPLFRLIGRPQCPTDLSDLVSTGGNADITLMREPRWLSADYASATDNLSSLVSSSIQECILEGIEKLGGSFKTLKRDVLLALGSHYVTYPSVEGTLWLQNMYEEDPNCWVGVPDIKKVDSVLQRNGQLMGSIASFPILCLANAAALDLYQRRENLDYSFGEYLRSALINGDDLVTIVDGDDQLHRFKQISAELGLDLTIGKSYIHDTYANINSAAYHYNLTALSSYIRERRHYMMYNPDSGAPRGEYFEYFPWKIHTPFPGGKYQHLPVPRSIGYFNFGLYIGQHKVQGRVGGESQNLDVLEHDPNFSTEIFDPPEYSYSNLPSGALKLLGRLQNRLKKKGLEIPKEGDRPYWAVANRIADGCPDEFRALIEREISREVYRRGEDIFLYQRAGDRTRKWRWARRNHRVPISAGGLGMFPGSSSRYYVTNVQRALAKTMRESLEQRGSLVDTQTPLRGPPPKSLNFRHPYSAREQREIEIPCTQINDVCTWRFPVTPLLSVGGYPDCV